MTESVVHAIAKTWKLHLVLYDISINIHSSTKMLKAIALISPFSILFNEILFINLFLSQLIRNHPKYHHNIGSPLPFVSCTTSPCALQVQKLSLLPVFDEISCIPRIYFVTVPLVTSPAIFVPSHIWLSRQQSYSSSSHHHCRYSLRSYWRFDFRSNHTTNSHQHHVVFSQSTIVQISATLFFHKRTIQRSFHVSKEQHFSYIHFRPNPNFSLKLFHSSLLYHQLHFKLSVYFDLYRN